MKILADYLGSSVKVVSVEQKGERVIAVIDGPGPYPDGKGGQLGDRGTIGGACIKSVSEANGSLLVELESPVKPGENEFLPDQRRRWDIAQQHTGQHVLSAAFVHVADIHTVSFHMGEEYSTIDLDVPFIEKNVLDEVEDLANEVLQRDMEVQELFVSVEDAAALGLRKPLSEKVKGPVRIIKIGDFDVAGCGGFHTDSTGQVGMIKIIATEKVKGQLTRVYAVSGNRALAYFRRYTDTLRELSKALTSSVEELPVRVTKLLEQARDNGLALSKLAEEHAKLIAANLPNDKIIYLEGYSEVGNFLAKSAKLDGKVLIFFDGQKYVLASETYDVRKIVGKMKEHFGGKGGGKESFATFQPASVPKAERLIALVETWI